VHGVRKTNRQAFDRLGQSVRCGHCHADLSAPAEPVDVPDVTCSITSSPRRACPCWWTLRRGAPCRVVAPEVEKVARSLRGRLLVAKVNSDVFPILPPLPDPIDSPFIVFRNGAESVRRSGALTRPAS
jgi:thioredoxin 2